MQGKPCVDCGKTTARQFADHKKPLVEEYYESGTIDPVKGRSVDAVQPQARHARLSRADVYVILRMKSGGKFRSKKDDCQ